MFKVSSSGGQLARLIARKETFIYIYLFIRRYIHVYTTEKITLARLFACKHSCCGRLARYPIAGIAYCMNVPSKRSLNSLAVSFLCWLSSRSMAWLIRRLVLESSSSRQAHIAMFRLAACGCVLLSYSSCSLE